MVVRYNKWVVRYNKCKKNLLEVEPSKKSSCFSRVGVPSLLMESS
jgi:hypothetical protein